MSSKRQFGNPKRIVGQKTPKPKIFIYCEGGKTEPDYFKALKRIYQQTLVEVEVISAVGVAKTVANKAIKAKKARKPSDSFDQKDEYWAVFDRDEHPNFEESINRCEAAGVSVAYAIPCFELWFILHYENYNQPNDHKTVQKYLEKICPDYDRNKRKTTDCAKLIQSILEAENRAESQYIQNEKVGERFRSPVTTVYQLTRRIRGL